MEPFFLSCTTCQARLKVRDESALGQILACPKCGSMVLVESPPGTTPSAGEPSQGKPKADSPRQAKSVVTPSTTPSQRDQSDSGPQLSGAQTPKTEAGVSGARPGRTFKFREDFEVPAEAAPPKTPRRMVTPAPPRQASFGGTSAADPEAQTEPADQETPAAAAGPEPDFLRKHQQVLWIGAAAIGGVALALVVIALLSSGGGNTSPEPTAITEASNPGDPKSSDHALAPDESATGSVPSVDDSAAPPSDDRPPQETHSDDASPSNGEPSPGTKSPGSTNEAAAAPVDPVDVTSADPPELAPDAEPAETDPAMADTSTAPPPSSDSGEPPKYPLGENAALESIAPPPVAPDVSPEVSKQLSAALIEVKYPQVPLADFARFVFDFTTIPVTLDVDQLLAAGVNAETKLDFDLRGVTVEKMLTAALEPAGMTFAVQQDQLLIIPLSGPPDELVTQTYDVSDLAPTGDDAKSLGQIIRTLVDSKSWMTAGGDATLTETERSLEVLQSPVGQFHVTRFLDRLRTARGLLPRSDLPPDQLDLAPSFVRAAERLSVPLSVNFSDPVPLRRIFSHLETDTDLRVLIDWQALAQAGVTPATTVSISVESKPMSELLDQLLQPLKLEYRVLDAQTLQIGSQSSIFAHPELDFYTVKNLSDTEAKRLIEEIKTTVGQPFFEGEGASGAILFDPPSHCLLVALPQPQQRVIAQWMRVNRRAGVEAGSEG